MLKKILNRKQDLKKIAKNKKVIIEYLQNIPKKVSKFRLKFLELRTKEEVRNRV